MTNKEKERCRQETYRAINRGLLTEKDACEECGKGWRVLIHHEDYTDPLNVRWLCDSCHQLLHKRRFVSCELPNGQRDDVERVAERNDQSMADVLRRYIREGLQRDARNGKPQ